MPNLYIIAGCNGAGKTTASYTILPGLLDCREFVNADSIAAALSPFNPESVAFEAGRIMLRRVDELLKDGADFAIETTLSTKSYVSLINDAQALGYKVSLLFFWLDSPKTAIQRVAARVAKGGHNIPTDVIIRRYKRGIYNLRDLFIPIVDRWMVYNSMDLAVEPIAEGHGIFETHVSNEHIWQIITQQSRVMEDTGTKHSELYLLILKGINTATRKMAEESAARGESLVVSVDGEVRLVPAAELLAGKDMK